MRTAEAVGASAGGQAAGDWLENRVNQAVFGTRGIGDLDLQFAVGAGEAAQECPRGTGTQVVAAVVAADRHGVGQHRGAVAVRNVVSNAMASST